MDTDRTMQEEALAGITDAMALALPPDVAAEGLAAVRRYLIAHVTHLLDRNPTLLMSILYRVDVAERDVKRAFSEGTPEALPATLADLLLARQLQKIESRRRYRAARREEDG